MQLREPCEAMEQLCEPVLLLINRSSYPDFGLG